MKLRLAPAARRAVEAAAESGFPDEVCGVLLGKAGDEPQVLEAHPCRNLDQERSRDRYQLDPAEQLKIEKAARERGLDVLGYYHSHPDHPSLASETDNSLSWEQTVYLIQSVRQGRCDSLQAWFRPPGQARLGEIALIDA